MACAFAFSSAFAQDPAVAPAADPAAAPPPPADPAAAVPVDPAAAPPPVPEPPKLPVQVEVSVKIIEFQVTKGLETGLSAYFANLTRSQLFGRAVEGGAALNTVDLTFPTSTAAGITVFLDQLRLNEGEIDVVIQALVDENRAVIVSEPTALVKIGDPIPTIVKTTQKVPYENAQVVGYTVAQITSFEETGVTFSVNAAQVIDDDGDWSPRSRHDTFVRLDVRASVREEGGRLVVALDDKAGTGDNKNAITVPEFISRSIDTHVWLRDGQVLMLGGLFRNSENTTISTAPWASQGEDLVQGTIDRFIPGTSIGNPISTSLGNKQKNELRRELVFLIKAKIWDPNLSITGDFGLSDEDEEKPKSSPADVINSLLEGISGIPRGLSPDNPLADQIPPRGKEKGGKP